MRVLFVCSRGRIRSVTAARVFADEGACETDYAGVLKDADVPVSVEQLEWADVICVMEKSHRRKLDAKYRKHLKGKRVVVLDIRDDYLPMQPALIHLLEERVAPLLP